MRLTLDEGNSSKEIRQRLENKSKTERIDKNKIDNEHNAERLCAVNNQSAKNI